MKITRENYEIWFLDYTEGKLSNEQVAELLLFVEANPDLKEELESFEIISVNEPGEVEFSGKNNLKKKQEPVINDSNREEYFISYSEGILNAEEKSAVEKFILANPSYEKELNQFISVRLKGEQFTHEERTFLKKGFFSYRNEDKDFWIVSYIDGRLNEKQLREFENALKNNLSLQNELNQYKRVVLTSDNSIVYNNKEELKQGGSRRAGFAWKRYFSYAAAACLLIFFMLPDGGEENSSTVAEINSNGKDSVITSPENKSSVTPETLIENFASVEEKNEKSINPVLNHQRQDEFVRHEKQEQIITNEKNDSVVKAPVQLNNLNPEIEVANDTSKSANKLNNTNEDVAVNNISPKSTAEFLTPVQFLRETANEKLFGDEQEGKAKENSSTEKNTRIGNVPVSVKSDKTEEYSAYGFSIGGFSFSRSVNK